MISFTCSSCGKAFKVPDEYAGKTARCKSCGASIKVPTPTVAAETPTRIPMRTRRLRADAEAMAEVFREFKTIRVTPLAGDPPEAYRVEYRLASLHRGPDGKPAPLDRHQIEIQLTAEYPRLSPKCKMLTPIFHPNIDSAGICVGDHWTAGERLIDLVVRIGEMLAYQAYNIQSPLDGESGDVG